MYAIDCILRCDMYIVEFVYDFLMLKDISFHLRFKYGSDFTWKIFPMKFLFHRKFAFNLNATVHLLPLVPLKKSNKALMFRKQ